MAHSRLRSESAGPSSTNRFLIPPVKDGEGTAVLAQPTLQQAKQAAQAPILAQRGDGGRDPSTPSTPSTSFDTGFSFSGTGVATAQAVSLGHAALSVAEEKTTPTVMGIGLSALQGLPGLIGLGAQVGVHEALARAKKSEVAKQRAKTPQTRRAQASSTNAARQAAANARQTAQDVVSLREAKQAGQTQALAEKFRQQVRGGGGGGNGGRAGVGDQADRGDPGRGGSAFA